MGRLLRGFGLDVSSVAGDNIRLHTVVQLFLGGLLNVFQGLQRAEPLITGFIFHFKEAFALGSLVNHADLPCPLAILFPHRLR